MAGAQRGAGGPGVRDPAVLADGNITTLSNFTPTQVGVHAHGPVVTDSAFYTYIVTNARRATLYTGHTNDLHARMEEHIRGTADSFTARYGLKHFVWFEGHDTRDEAFTRERRLKEWKRQWKLNLIEEFNPLWLDLHTVPFWPLPIRDTQPEDHARCLQHRVDPDLRLDEVGIM